MAWRNIQLNITFPAIAQCDITNFSLLDLTTWPDDWSSYVNTPSAVQSDFNIPAGTGIWTTVMGSDLWRIDGNITTSGSATIRLYMQGYNNYLGYGNEFIASGRTWGYVAAVNDETQMGFIAFLAKRTDRTNFSKWSGTTPPYPASKAPQSQTLIRSLMYTLLTGNEFHNHKSNGGGATHIAKRTGTLASIGSSNLSDVLLVSGGGGGGLLVGETAYEGKEAGGISGSGDNSANQSTGNAFGLGESDSSASGGGGGLYGGYKGTNSKGGGAGSGYIGNSLLSNKKMVGYNVPTSDAESTKTESVQIYSPAPLANTPKIGNGFARIKLIRESLEVNLWDIVLKSDLSAAVNCGSAPSTAQLNSDDILFYGQTQKTKPTLTDGVLYHAGSTDYTTSYINFPLKQEYTILGGSSKVNFIAKAQDAYHNQWIHAGVLLSTQYGNFLSEYAYNVSGSGYTEAVPVDAFGLYESGKTLSSPQTVRRINICFDYGTWEMFDIKVNILG